MAKSAEERRLEAERENHRAIAEAVRDSNPREAERQDNAARGLDHELGHMSGFDPGSNKT